jgi:regulatory protein
VRRPGGRKALDPEQAADARAAHTAAIALLARRDYASAELRRKLLQRGYAPDAVSQALAQLTENKLVDDGRYGANFVAYRSRRGQGPARIRNELRRSGLADEQIEEAVKGGEDTPDFLALAREARRRKFGPDLPADRKERARQARFLQYRGFSTDHIRAVLEGAPEDSDEGAEPGGDPDPNQA